MIYTECSQCNVVCSVEVSFFCNPYIISSSHTLPHSVWQKFGTTSLLGRDYVLAPDKQQHSSQREATTLCLKRHHYHLDKETEFRQSFKEPFTKVLGVKAAWFLQLVKDLSEKKNNPKQNRLISAPEWELYPLSAAQNPTLSWRWHYHISLP